MNRFLKKIASRALLYLIIIILCNVVFNTFLFKGKTLLHKKFINSHTAKDICFWGDSKTVFNYDHGVLAKKFKDRSIYNYAYTGFSLKDNIEFYGDNFCNCAINIVNLEEHTQGHDLVNNKWAYLLSKTVTLADFLFISKKNQILQNHHQGFVSFDKNFRELLGKKDFTPKEIEKMKLGITKAHNILDSLTRHNTNNIIFVTHPDRRFRKDFYKEHDIGFDTVAYLNGRKYVDFRAVQALEADTLYFDSHHHNKQGAHLFTIEFLKQISLH